MSCYSLTNKAQSTCQKLSYSCMKVVVSVLSISWTALVEHVALGPSIESCNQVRILGQSETRSRALVGSLWGSGCLSITARGFKLHNLWWYLDMPHIICDIVYAPFEHIVWRSNYESVYDPASKSCCMKLTVGWSDGNKDYWIQLL